MKYALVFTVLAVLLAVKAIASAEVGGYATGAFEGYLALGLLALAVAYGLKQTGVAVEEVTRNPRWNLALHVLLTPYRLIALLAPTLNRWVDRRAGMSLVAPGVYVGRLPSRAERSRLAERGIDAVVNLCAELPCHRSAEGGPSLAYVPILDGSPPSDRQFGEATDWVIARRLEQRTVLIHCAQGHGRSATIAAVALCRLGLASSFDDAVRQIQLVRPGARPSRAQRLAAIRFLTLIERFENAKRAGLSTRPFA